MLRTLIPLILLLSLAAVSPVLTHPATAASLQGIVIDAGTREPLAGAHVRVIGTQLGDATDADGRFSIEHIPSGAVKVEVSHLGYATITEKLAIPAQGLSDVELYLIPEAVELDQVVYTATRTMQLLKNVPITTELVTAAEIEKAVAFNVSDALDNEIGVDVREDFAGQGVMLQGMDPERVLILVDGNRVIGRVNGSIDLSQLSTQNVKQIEVVKGAVSTLYGSEAIGGVINVITDDNPKPLTLSAQVAGGGYLPAPRNDELDRLRLAADLASYGLDATMSRGKANFAAGLRYDTNGIMDSDPTTNHTEGIEGADKVYGHARLSYDITKPATLTLGVRTQQEKKHWIEDAGLQSVQVSYDDEEYNRRVDLSGEWTCRPGWAEMYSAKVYRSQNTHDWSKYTQGDVRHRKDYSESDEDYTEVGAQLTRRIGLAHRVTMGADHYWWNIEAHNRMGASLSSDFAAKLTAWDAFLQDEWLLLSNLTLVPGVRYEQHKVYGVHISPKLSAMWSPVESINLRASVGRGYRAPSSKELYYTFNHASAGYIVQGNPDLVPETSTSYTISAEHTYENRSTSRISFFYNDLENLIDFDSLGVTEEYYTGIYQYENIVSAWTRGMELERTFRVAKRWRLGIAYSFLETLNRETELPLLRRPKHSGRFLVNWSPDPWNLRLWGRYTGEMYFQDIFGTDDQISSETTEPYTLWNLTVSRDFSAGLRAAFKVENILDQTHTRYGPYRGRTVSMVLSYKYSAAPW